MSKNSRQNSSSTTKSTATSKISNNKTVKKQNKTTFSLNFIKSMAKLQRGLFLMPNNRYSIPKSSNKKNKK